MTVETGSHWQAEVDWAWVDTAAAADADDDHPHVVVSRIKEGTRKRLYEHGEGELDREMDKMYKRDYWEDPAYAPLLELSGLLLARAEAIECFSERALRATDAMLAQRWQEWERRSRAADESEPARAADAGEGRLFCSGAEDSVGQGMATSPWISTWICRPISQPSTCCEPWMLYL